MRALKKSCIVNQNAKMTAAYAESREKFAKKSLLTKKMNEERRGEDALKS